MECSNRIEILKLEFTTKQLRFKFNSNFKFHYLYDCHNTSWKELMNFKWSWVGIKVWITFFFLIFDEFLSALIST